jgi:hypothetical protein
MNLEALEMRSIIDWEYSGYSPRNKKWGATGDEHLANFKDEESCSQTGRHH